jgi:hypothetical protein
VKRLAIALLLAAPAAAEPWPTPVAVRAALASTAAAIPAVLLDHENKARGDYDWRSGRWAEYETAWHSGQAILALLEAHRHLKDPALLAAARRAGDWWVAQEIRSGPLKGLVNAAHGDRLGSLINFTTIGNGTEGLFRLSRATGDRRYGDTATRSVRWLLANMRTPDPGLFYNIVEPGTGRIWTDRSPHHPDARPATLQQVARPNIEGSPFLDACRHSGDRRLCAAHLDLARRTAATQDENGFWMAFEPNNPETGRIHPRFNIWNAEALLRATELADDPAFEAAALKTARAMQKLMRSDGAIAYDNFLDGRVTPDSSLTGSATAFAGLLWLQMRARGHSEFDADIDRAARWILANRFATDHPDPNLRGLVLETRTRGAAEGRRILVRDIGTSFGVRFLAAWLDHHGEKP